MIADGQTLALFAVKLGFTAAALLAIGLSLHSALAISSPNNDAASRRLATIASALTCVFMLARLALLNAQLGGSFTAAFDPSFFAWTWSALGPATLATILGGLGAILAAALDNRWLAAGSALLLAAGFGLTGHAAATDQAAIASPVAVFHVLIAGFWSLLRSAFIRGPGLVTKR